MSANLNEIKIITHGNVAVRIIKDNLKKEFRVEGGYANRDDLFNLLMTYPFAGWETWEEIEPVALEHLRMALEHSRFKRRRMAQSFDRGAVTLEEAYEHAREMTEGLKKSGQYRKAPDKVE